jgi:hypothetical protein
MTAARKTLPAQTRAKTLKANATDLCMHCGECWEARELDDVGLCPTCADHVCGSCNTHVGALALEEADDGVWLCKPCAEAEHREREALEGDGRPVAMNLSEEWV